MLKKKSYAFRRRRRLGVRQVFCGSKQPRASAQSGALFFVMASSPDRFATVGVSGDGGGGLGLFSLLEAAAQPSNTRGAVLWAKAQAADGDGRLPATFLGKLPGARKATRLVKASRTSSPPWRLS